MAGTSEIVVARASAGYGGPPVVEGVDLRLRAGEPPAALVGASGAGKSTILGLVTGAVRATSGSVTWDGKTVGKLGRRDRKEFAVAVRTVSQDGMDPELARRRAADVVREALEQARKAGRETGRSAEAVLGEIGLDARAAGQAVHTLSGGQRQRLAIAVALAAGPRLLVLDEPATALDGASKAEVIALVERTARERGIGVLVATHDLPLVERLCPTVHLVAEGRIVESGSLAALVHEPQHEAARRFAESVPGAFGGWQPARG